MLSVGLALLCVGLFAVTATAPSRVADEYTYPAREFVRERRFDIPKNDKASQERSTWREVTSDLIFYQKSDWLLDIGKLLVMPGFPTEKSKLTPMTWIGDPAPGDRVRLTYWVADEKPNFVYGVRLEALPSRSLPAAPFDTLLTPTAIPTLPPLP